VEKVSKKLNAKKPKVYSFDIATFLIIAELIIKLVKWLQEYRKFKHAELTLLQRSALWVTIKFSNLKGASYSEVVDAIFENVTEEDFDAFKKRESV
jgi:hypothetical protein